jgi:hypothetical protein
MASIGIQKEKRFPPSPMNHMEETRTHNVLKKRTEKEIKLYLLRQTFRFLFASSPSSSGGVR